MGISTYLRSRYLRNLFNQGYQDGIGSAAAKVNRKAYLAGKTAAENGESLDSAWTTFEMDEAGGDDVDDDEIEAEGEEADGADDCDEDEMDEGDDEHGDYEDDDEGEGFDAE